MSVQNVQVSRPQASLYNDATLLSPGAHFRILHLHSSSEDTSPIICDITCHHISSRQHFIALSYVWGSNDRTHRATIGGQDSPLTASLDEAVRQIRSRDEVVAVWIDQICINQDDSTEKNGQVALMRRIYTAAAQVLVWLGQEADDSDAVMELWHDVGLEARRLGRERYWTNEAIG